MLNKLLLCTVLGLIACSRALPRASRQSDVVGPNLEPRQVRDYLRLIPLSPRLRELYSKLGMDVDRTCFWLVNYIEGNGNQVRWLELWRCGGNDKLIYPLMLLDQETTVRSTDGKKDLGFVSYHINESNFEDDEPKPLFGDIEEVGGLCIGYLAENCDLVLDESGVISELRVKSDSGPQFPETF